MDKKPNEISRYIDIHRAHRPSWSPDGTQLAFVTDKTGLDQAWIVAMNGQEPKQLSHFNDRVGLVSWSPTGQYVLVTVDSNGDEHDQIYLIHATDGSLQPLTHEPSVIHYFGAWSPDGQYICYSCNRRHQAFFDVWVQHIFTGESRCVLADDATLIPQAWSPDGTALVVSRRNTDLDNDLFLVSVEDGESNLLTIHDGEAAYENPCFAPDGRTLYVLTNYQREFLAPAALDLTVKVSLGTHVPIKILVQTSWDAEGNLTLTRDGQLLAWALNENGRSRLVFYNVYIKQELPVPTLPTGVIQGLTWAPDKTVVAFDFNGTRHNGNIWIASPQTITASQLTSVPIDDLDISLLIEPELIHYRSFDDIEIPAYYYRPSAIFRKKTSGLPVIIFIHGGPESQFRPLYAAPAMPPIQYYLKRGFAVFAPNVRGSRGYGKTFIHLDDVQLRPNSIADVKAGVEWLIQYGGADSKRIGVMGRSYGGFMVLAAITTYPDLWAAAVDIVGIANFLTFFEHTGVWRRRLRYPEYGDPIRDKDFLHEISPIFKVDRITAPLLVLHGRNDARVPVEEAEQIVAALQALNRIAELMIFPNEGHFMLRKSTQLKAYTATGDWFERYMG